MNEQELKKRYEAYTDCWKFFKKWCEPKTDDDWEQLLKEAAELRKKDEDMELRKRLITETVLEINRLAKERRNEKRRN